MSDENKKFDCFDADGFYLARAMVDTEAEVKALLKERLLRAPEHLQPRVAELQATMILGIGKLSWLIAPPHIRRRMETYADSISEDYLKRHPEHRPADEGDEGPAVLVVEVTTETRREPIQAPASTVLKN